MFQACTIAGSDSGGGAGIQADIKVFAAHGVYGTSVITAVTAQNTRGITSVYNIPAKIIAQQLNAVLSDFNISAIKTGMLPSSAIIESVVKGLEKQQVKNLVVDPVMVSSSGFKLMSRNAITVMKKKLFPLALLVTPNIPEAEILANMNIHSTEDVQEAAKRIMEFGCRNVLIKGGHSEFAPATDILYDGKMFHQFKAQLIRTRHTHGTGCVYSAAITAHLAKGEQLAAAIRKSKKYITQAIEQGLALGHGNGPVNPFPTKYTLW